MRASLITPGPLGMCDTSPIADAPRDTARAASSMEAIQQTLTLTAFVRAIESGILRWGTSSGTVRLKLR
jgi:hypothetical protein